jgi:hypothetical protein
MANNILVVEDDVVVSKLLFEFLIKSGFNTKPSVPMKVRHLPLEKLV